MNVQRFKKAYIPGIDYMGQRGFDAIAG